MSLVVFAQSRHGIVAASDSRSTITGDAGPYLENDNTKKIFSNEVFLLGTYGENKFLKEHVTLPLSQAIDHCLEITDGLEPEEFLKDLYEELTETFLSSPNTRYNFIAGWKQRTYDEYIVSFFSLSRVGVHYDGTNNPNCLAFCTSPMTPNSICSNPSWTILEMEDRCKKLVRGIIDLGDLFLPYNPVGGAIQIASLV